MSEHGHAADNPANQQTAPRRIMLSDEVIDSWREKLTLPNNIRRLVVDLQMGKAFHLYYECLGDAALLEVQPPSSGVYINVGEDDEE